MTLALQAVVLSSVSVPGASKLKGAAPLLHPPDVAQTTDLQLIGIQGARGPFQMEGQTMVRCRSMHGISGRGSRDKGLHPGELKG